jgi:hypothetical protein
MNEEDINLETPVAIRSRLDILFGIAIIILSVVFIVWVIPMGVDVPASVKALPLSPAFLPYTLSSLFGLMGLVCLLQATLGYGIPKETSELTFVARRKWQSKFALILVIFSAFYTLPEILGMLPVSIICMGILVFFGGERNLRRGILVSVIIPFGVWLFFTQIAQVPLPEGLIGGYFSS